MNDMTENYETLDGNQIYLNEDQICFMYEDTQNNGYYIVIMSSGDRLSVKSLN